MLTYKRAIAVAVAVLCFFFFLRSFHSEPAKITADALPRPGPVFPSPETKHDTTQPAVAKESTDSATWKAGEAYSKQKAKPQIPMKDLRAKPLKKQLEYQFPYDPQSKFPAYIWQTWKYTPSSGEFDETFREGEASWTVHHPTFVHEVITDSVAATLIKHLYASVPEVVEAYHTLPLPVLKADFFRYLILLARGGIYSDIDTAALRPATEWVPENVPRSSYGMVIGIEADPDRPDWKDWYARRVQFCQWTIQSKPGHPILRDMVANITEETLRRKSEGRLEKTTKGIMDWTGPALWTDYIFNFFNDPEYFDMATSKGNITWEHFTGIKAAKKVGDVIVLPITSFSPGIRTMGAGEDDDPMAFVKHQFEGTWKPEAERHIGGGN